MASSKKKGEIRQAPKNLDKMLFNNYREEERLQQKLKDLTNKMRGLELDREKVQMHNEMRLNKRRNSSPAIVQLVSRPATRVRHPSSQEMPARPPSNRRRGSVNDPVNDYLLTEFRRVSEVIPGILSSLTKDDKAEEDQWDVGGGEGQVGNRRSTTASARRSTLSSLATPQLRLDPDLKAFVSKEAGQSRDSPNIENIVTMISSIKTLREDMAGKKRFEFTRSKTSFTDLLKNIHEEERRGSVSDTYTDGACVLLRRKMSKARRASCPAMDAAPAQQGGQTGATVGVTGASGPVLPPQRRLSRSTTSVSPSSVNRHQARDLEGMRAMLQEEDRQLTEIKVATELRRYDDIRTRIGHFLHEVKGPRRRCSLPVPSSRDQMIEEDG